MATLDTPRVPETSKASEKELVRQAQGGSRASAAALRERCRGALDGVVCWWSRERELRAEEREEMWQEAEVGFFRAVAGYGKGRRKRSKPSGFRTFMNLVVRDHLDKWSRDRQRAECHYDWSADWEVVLERRALQRHRDRFDLAAPGPRAEDPVSSALRQESLARLTEGVRRLDARQRLLCERIRAGRSLREAAAELGLSYYKAKRSFRRAKALLRHVVL
jgi:RNA polymerase sigma factor (sigma-70 family)